jgi:hypothetical protein
MSQQEMVDLVTTKRQRVQQYNDMINSALSYTEKQRLVNYRGKLIWQIVELKEVLLKTYNHVI